MTPKSYEDGRLGRNLGALQQSYREVLDATKHQDDKIGRLFTGISFLTAAALATANLGSSRYLSQVYQEFPVPPAMVTLAVYLILVVISVMLLISSFATPLRLPGLSRNMPTVAVDYVGSPPVRSSQIYFGEIAKVGLEEWERKWRTGRTESLELELAQSLVKETHNLAARTQFKYARTSEAIAIFNLALLFLSLTIIFCLIAALWPNASPPITIGAWSRAALGAMFGMFMFVQLQGQIRYSRQTVDELSQQGIVHALARYTWALSATVWVFLVGSGAAMSWLTPQLMYVPVFLGAVALSWGASSTFKRTKRKMAWLGTVVAIVMGLGVTSCLTLSTPDYAAFFGCAVGVVAVLTTSSLLLPSIGLSRLRREFEERRSKVGTSR